MAKVTDQQLSSFAKKFATVIDAALANPSNIKQITQYYEQAKTTCCSDGDSVITAITNKQDSPDLYLKILFDQLRPLFMQPVDQNLTLQSIDFFIRALATISKVSTPGIWQNIFHQYIMSAKDDFRYDQFIETLKQFRANLNPAFWWTILCVQDECAYVDKLRIFIDNFMVPYLTVDESKMDIPKILNPGMPNQILNAFQVLRSINNIETRNKFCRVMFIPVFDIYLVRIGSYNGLFSYKAKFNKKSREEAERVLTIIKGQGEDVLRDLLRFFVLLANNFEQPQVEMFNVNNEWLIEALRLRKIMKIVYRLVPTNATSIFQYVVENLSQTIIRPLLTFSVQFDTHRCDLILSHANDPQWETWIKSFVGSLTVVLAPVLLKLDQSEVESKTNELKVRNKRMKVQKSNDILENADEVFVNPLMFETRIPGVDKSQISHSFRLNLNNKSKTPYKKWTFEAANSYIKEIVSKCGYEKECVSIIIQRLAPTQKRLIIQYPTINHRYMAENFLDFCQKDISPELLRSMITLTEASSVTEDLTDAQRKKYVDNILEALKSPELVQDASTTVLFCLSHLSPYAFKLCAPFLLANPQPNFDIFLRTLTSIYSIVYNSTSIENGNREHVLSELMKHFIGYVQKEPRNEVTISLVITLLFEEIRSNSPTVSDGLKTLLNTFISKKEDVPQSQLRMLSVFNDNFSIVDRKVPNFFGKFIDCLKDILKNRKTDKALFQITCETLVDTLLHTNKGRDTLLSIKEELWPTIESLDANSPSSSSSSSSSLPLSASSSSPNSMSSNSLASNPLSPNSTSSNPLSPNSIPPNSMASASSDGNAPSKKDMFCFSVNQFISKYHHPLTELNMVNPSEEGADPANHAYVVVDKLAIQSLYYKPDHVSVSSKTMNGSYVYNIQSRNPNLLLPPQSKRPLLHQEKSENEENEKDNFGPIEEEDTDFMKAFSSFVDEISTSALADQSGQPDAFTGWRDCSPTDFKYSQNKPSEEKTTNMSAQTPRPKDQYSNRNSVGALRTNPTSDPKVIYPSEHATSFYGSLYSNSNNSHIQNPKIKFKQSFSLLDIAANSLFTTPCRETIKLGLIYVQNGQTEQNKILFNDWKVVSPQFRSFVSSLGQIVDLSTHTGFVGKLDSSNTFSNGRYQLYYGNDRFEMMFHTAPLLPTDFKDDQQIYKKRHIGNDYVHIVWSEHAFDYATTTITSQFNDAHVIIYPILGTSDFVRVVVHRKNKVEPEVQMKFGPLLLGENVVSKHALADLVRWTAIFADRATRDYQLPNCMFVTSMDTLLKAEPAKGGHQ